MAPCLSITILVYRSSPYVLLGLIVLHFKLMGVNWLSEITLLLALLRWSRAHLFSFILFHFKWQKILHYFFIIFVQFLIQRTRISKHSHLNSTFYLLKNSQPAIEIWNLDVLDPLEPTAVLGGLVPEKKFPKKGKKGKKVVDDDLCIGSHEAAVMGLSWYVLT